MDLFITKRIRSADEAGHGPTLRRHLGPWGLIALGIGMIVGAGLFSLTGIAAAENAGPAVTISFLVAALGCVFAGMCYSELATMIPRAGSAYTYAYATLGELIAWIIGWDLVLEYAVGASAVSVSWSKYVLSLLHDFGIDFPARFAIGPFETMKLADGSQIGGLVNLPAIFIIAVLSLLLMRGIRESAAVNGVIVVIKLSIAVIFIVIGAFYVKWANLTPYIPANDGSFGHYGWSGILRGAGVIFFAYIGFDAVSTAAQETKNPQRTMPIGILGSLVICTILYVAFAFVLTGMVKYTAMKGDAAPVATAIALTPYPWLQALIKIGIICGFSSVILVALLGQSRVFFSMAEDGLLPRAFAAIHPTWQTPWRSNLVFMLFGSALAGFVPISLLAHMTSIGTLLAFVIVCAGVMVLRRARPDLPRPYRTPLVPLVPLLGIAVCATMMYSLGPDNWWRLLVWLVIGLAIYFGYSRRHSRRRQQASADATDFPHPATSATFAGNKPTKP
ncbi:MAG TPA: amino acid permease [Stellaceae bacterium]|nr:amino acid permease [Stellaceae bacterium]